MMDASDEGMADTFTSLVSNSRDDIQAGRAYDAFLRLNRMEYLLKRYKKIINAGY